MGLLLAVLLAFLTPLKLIALFVLFLLQTDQAALPNWATSIAAVVAVIVGLILHFVPQVPSRVVSLIGVLAFFASSVGAYLSFLPPGVGRAIAGVAFILVAINERIQGGKSTVDPTAAGSK